MWTQYSLYNILTKLSVYCVGGYDVQKNPPLTLTMSLKKTIQSFQPISFKHWILHYPPLYSKWFPLFRFAKHTLYSFLLFYMPHIHYLPCYIYVNNIWWRITDMKLTTQSSAPLYSYRPLIPNILLTTLLLQTLNLCSSLDVRHQISHPHKMTGKMSGL